MTASGCALRHRWVAAATVTLLTMTSACGGSDPPDAESTSTTEAATSTTPSTVPERPTSTTTTVYDPTTVEGQVEAAYLKSWDVYAEAVYNLELDEAALAEVYGEPLLSVVTNEISHRVEDRRAALVRVEHSYTVRLTEEGVALVLDQYKNHQVLIDPETHDPVEPDPNEELADAFTVRLVEGRWMVTDQVRA